MKHCLFKPFLLIMLDIVLPKCSVCPWPPDCFLYQLQIPCLFSHLFSDYLTHDCHCEVHIIFSNAHWWLDSKYLAGRKIKFHKQCIMFVSLKEITPIIKKKKKTRFKLSAYLSSLCAVCIRYFFEKYRCLKNIQNYLHVFSSLHFQSGLLFRQQLRDAWAPPRFPVHLQLAKVF